jgi:hypothetical protein
MRESSRRRIVGRIVSGLRAPAVWVLISQLLVAAIIGVHGIRHWRVWIGVGRVGR